MTNGRRPAFLLAHEFVPDGRLLHIRRLVTPEPTMATLGNLIAHAVEFAVRLQYQALLYSLPAGPQRRRLIALDSGIASFQSLKTILETRLSLRLHPHPERRPATPVRFLA
jgi:hypothetical protein